MAENQQRRKSAVGKPTALQALNPVPEAEAEAPTQRRISTIMPPDRQQQMIMQNQRRTSAVQAPNLLQLQVMAAANDPKRRRSVIQQPTASQISIPDKFRKHSVVKAPMLNQLQALQKDPAAFGIEQKPEATVSVRKHSKAEVEEYYSHVKTISKFRKSQSSSSLSSCHSTISSVSSSVSVSSDMYRSENGVGQPEWPMRWIVDKTGKQPGQIKGIKDVCVLRNSGNIAVTESKNSRIQIFSQSGKSVAILGPESDNDRTATSFSNPLSFRKIDPTGICETNINNLLAVTDHNRLLYIDTSTICGELKAEVIISNRNSLHGVAVTQNSRIILSEVGTQASVGIFETNGKLIREYKGTFKMPSYLAWNEEYEITAVSDSEEHAVFLYDANGHLLNKLGQKKNEDVSPLIYPSGVSWFSEGRLLVVDRAGHRVVLFDLRNMSAENILTEQDGLNQPVALGTNERNRIVVTEEFHDYEVDKYRLKMFKHRSSQTHDNEY